MPLVHPKYKVAVVQAAPVWLDLDAGIDKTIELINEAADPAGHYSRPDVTRLLINKTRMRRVEAFALPVDRAENVDAAYREGV